MIAGNKIDLQRERVVSLEDAEKSVFSFLAFAFCVPPLTVHRCRYALSVGAQHFSTSAKLNKGLNEMFLALTRSLLKTSPSAKAATPRSGTRGGGITIASDDGAASKPAGSSGGGCCG